MLKKRKRFTIFISLIICLSTFTNAYCKIIKKNNSKEVTISNEGDYYNVIIDFSSGKSHEEIGQKLGNEIHNIIPDYEKLIDSYLKDILSSEELYTVFLNRSKIVKQKMKKIYRDEVNGFASTLSTKDNILGDNKLSSDEFFLLNLIPDIVRGTQCSALSVFKDRSFSKSTITGRILDWDSGSQNQLAKIQSIITFKNGHKSICSIGYLGYMGIISGFNNDKIFAAILDSPNGEEFTEIDKKSYPFDLRYALENFDNLNSIGNFMISPKNSYSFSHLIFLSDPNSSKVVENNIGSKDDSLRILRNEKTILNDGLFWGIDNSIASVNSFLTKGNLDNHTQIPSNINRWATLKQELLSKGEIVTFAELKAIMSYFTGAKPENQELGDLYNSYTQQIIIFEPKSYQLEIAFRPQIGEILTKPRFTKIAIKF